MRFNFFISHELIDEAEFATHEDGFLYARVLAIVYGSPVRVQATNEPYGFVFKQRNDFEIIW
jgi:hypothetical protein